jgi:hypothetical protein
MIIQLAPDAPLAIRLLAGAGLFTHIAGASLGMASGAVSILAKKGGRLHRLAGNVFFGSMLAMGGAAAITGPFLPDRLTATMGAFIVYLVATSWMAVRRPAGHVGAFEPLAALYGLGAAFLFISLGAFGMTMHHGVLDHEPAALGYFAGLIALIGVASDVGVIRAGGIAGPARTRRHLWRMTVALAITWGSFAGQPRAQPEAIRGAGWLFLPALGILLLLAYWMIRTRGPRRRKPAPAVAAA